MKEKKTDMIIGRNPVAEALKSGREMERILIQKGAGGSVGKILSLAKERGVILQYEEKEFLDRKAGGGRHQGVIAFVSAHEYAGVEDMLALAEKRGEPPFLIVLDELEDPHNLGAVMRTAECAGAHGVIISRRRAGGLTETVARTSAGAVEYLPCARVTNIPRTLDELKKKGIWVYACDMDGETYWKQDLTGPVALVIGSEGRGISRLVREKCDFAVSIPMVGKITSLNASNAAAILMYEVRKQRDGK
ncbi:MAG: 23S rRNA (guanosine(2251)-2'-O)-methyltransferase RlmB [Hornefia butyriciproducens]|uniref:23S rRNA (guanosine(2251)-2'-O)-methyltransferase RlmB n=1 Tax=Hornefia butyriciproducens TaxID=2652293 RepID=UPI002A75DAC2|nr:23S rRNA (guanosine(2251)-2'-O)-methyltransferase RlmB [Hornefia butyriciproducens]MDY2991089.1 23S rRNA (guanosine(2251)-2'-O)-methyltransferase RlmB [Hornefia butyriciproducens]